MDMEKRKVILVTDGDVIAQEAVEEAARKIGGRCISGSAGNPTPKSGYEIVELIRQTPHGPVVVMVDDRGHTGTGKGEKAMDYLLNCNDIEVLGVIAVASNTKKITGISVDCSIDKEGKVTKNAVDKYGNVKDSKILKGDTVDILNKTAPPVIVGIGDPGKMDGRDSTEIGAPILTKALEEIIKKKHPSDIG